MAWPFNTPEYSTTRPSGIDTLMNYQDQIRSLPGGNYQGWQDLIVDPVRQENLAASDFNQALESGVYDDTETYMKEPGETLFAENFRLSDLNPFKKDNRNIFGYQRRPGDFNFPSVMGGIMNTVKDQFEYRPATEQAWDPNTGQFVSAEEQDKMNALGGYYSDAARNQRRQRARVANMLARQAAGKRFSETNLKRLQDLGYGENITDTITTTTGGSTTPNVHGGGSERSFTQTSPAGISQAVSRAARGGQGPRGAGAMSGWRLAQGGRAGYREGELVDEDVNIAGPGFDVNENIEMAGYIDPQDALNDMSMNIFGKPLHDLTPEEYEMLIDMANDQAAAPEQAQGLASLV